MENKLEQFGRRALELMEAREEWDEDFCDTLGGVADELGLMRLDEDQAFRAVWPEVPAKENSKRLTTSDVFTKWEQEGDEDEGEENLVKLVTLFDIITGGTPMLDPDTDVEAELVDDFVYDQEGNALEVSCMSSSGQPDAMDPDKLARALDVAYAALSNDYTEHHVTCALDMTEDEVAALKSELLRFKGQPPMVYWSVVGRVPMRENMLFTCSGPGMTREQAVLRFATHLSDCGEYDGTEWESMPLEEREISLDAVINSSSPMTADEDDTYFDFDN